MMKFGFHLVGMLPIQCAARNANLQIKRHFANAKYLKTQLKKLDVDVILWQ